MGSYTVNSSFISLMVILQYKVDQGIYYAYVFIFIFRSHFIFSQNPVESLIAKYLQILSLQIPQMRHMSVMYLCDVSI